MIGRIEYIDPTGLSGLGCAACGGECDIFDGLGKAKPASGITVADARKLLKMQQHLANQSRQRENAIRRLVANERVRAVRDEQTMMAAQQAQDAADASYTQALDDAQADAQAKQDAYDAAFAAGGGGVQAGSYIDGGYDPLLDDGSFIVDDGTDFYSGESFDSLIGSSNDAGGDFTDDEMLGLAGFNFGSLLPIAGAVGGTFVAPGIGTAAGASVGGMLANIFAGGGNKKKKSLLPDTSTMPANAGPASPGGIGGAAIPLAVFTLLLLGGR